MMKMKKWIGTIIVLTIYVISLAGCYAENFISSGVEGDKMGKQLIKYLSENDEKGLKSMFCNQTKSSPDLDLDIEYALDFFEGAVISDDWMRVGFSEEAIDNGRVTEIVYHFLIEDVKTDESGIYEIKFSGYLVYAKDKDLVGISEIKIQSSDGTECVIGEFVEE